MRKKSSVEELTCPYCAKGYKTEQGIVKHIDKCPKKGRYETIGTPVCGLAFSMWQAFMQINGLRIKENVEPLDQFLRGGEYKSFILVAKHYLEHPITNMDEFILYVMESGLPIYKWTDANLYSEFVNTTTRQESIHEGIIRSIEGLQAWATETGYEINEFFDVVKPERFLHMISTGQISSWLFYTVQVETSNKVLNQMTDTEFETFVKYCDPHVWQYKAYVNMKSVDEYRQVYKDMGW